MAGTLWWLDMSNQQARLYISMADGIVIIMNCSTFFFFFKEKSFSFSAHLSWKLLLHSVRHTVMQYLILPADDAHVILLCSKKLAETSRSVPLSTYIHLFSLVTEVSINTIKISIMRNCESRSLRSSCRSKFLFLFQTWSSSIRADINLCQSVPWTVWKIQFSGGGGRGIHLLLWSPLQKSRVDMRVSTVCNL